MILSLTSLVNLLQKIHIEESGPKVAKNNVLYKCPLQTFSELISLELARSFVKGDLLFANLFSFSAYVIILH